MSFSEAITQRSDARTRRDYLLRYHPNNKKEIKELKKIEKEAQKKVDEAMQS